MQDGARTKDFNDEWFTEPLLDATEQFYETVAEHDGPKDDYEDLYSECGNVFLKQIKETCFEALEEERQYNNSFRTRLQHRWGGPFALLEIFIMMNRKAGRELNALYTEEKAKGDYVFDALRRLHARACKVSMEILTLLEAGYADGAFARWRSLHETAATAYFIKQKGQETAERFLLHRTIDDYHELTSYQKHMETLGHEPLDEEMIDVLEDNRDDLLDRFGQEYDGLYGWAAPDFSGGRVGFKQIEEAGGVDHLRPFYKFASDNVHAGSKGTIYQMGMGNDDDYPPKTLLSGPSNYGLADPGQNTALSLHQVTTVLLTHDPDHHRLIYLKAADSLREAIQNSFVETQAELEDEIEEMNQDGSA